MGMFWYTYRSSTVKKFSLFTEVDENKKHEIFVLTNNLVNEVLQPVAFTRVLVEVHFKVFKPGARQPQAGMRLVS